MAGRREQQKEARKRRILKAADQLFTTRGYTETSLGMIHGATTALSDTDVCSHATDRFHFATTRRALRRLWAGSSSSGCVTPTRSQQERVDLAAEALPVSGAMDRIVALRSP